MGVLDTLLGWIGKSKRVPDSNQCMEQSFELIREGNGVEAIALMRKCVHQTREQCGDRSIQYAESLSQLGTVVCGTGNYEQGADFCQKAADACPATQEGQKARLTYLMNAGQLFANYGNAEKAIPILESSLSERRDFYGDGHAGVAYGQQVLAEALLAEQSYTEGLQHAIAAEELFLAERHQEFPATYALRAALASAEGSNRDRIWSSLADFPEDVVTEVINHSDRMARLMGEPLGIAYLEQLADWCESYLPDNIVLRANTMAQWSNLASDQGNIEALGRNADRIGHLVDVLPQASERINMLQGMALNLSQAGRPEEEIRATYERAAIEADGDNVCTAEVSRNWAIFEADLGYVEDAASLYDAAIDYSREAGDEGKELLGRSLIAKGIFLQHQKQLDEAQSLIRQGNDMLPATHADAACGVLHLVALESGLSCCCNGGEGMQKESLAILAQKFFEQSGLGDLLEDVGFGDKGLQVKVARRPTDEEMERLQIAHSVFVAQIRGVG